MDDYREGPVLSLNFNVLTKEMRDELIHIMGKLVYLLQDSHSKLRTG